MAKYTVTLWEDDDHVKITAAGPYAGKTGVVKGHSYGPQKTDAEIVVRFDEPVKVPAKAIEDPPGSGHARMVAEHTIDIVEVLASQLEAA